MLELKNISFKVKALDSNEEITILDNISFSIDTGKILVITGPNGSRKIYTCQNYNGNRKAR